MVIKTPTGSVVELSSPEMDPVHMLGRTTLRSSWGSPVPERARGAGPEASLLQGWGSLQTEVAGGRKMRTYGHSATGHRADSGQSWPPVRV